MSCAASAATASISARAAVTASRILASAASALRLILSAAFLTFASVSLALAWLPRSFRLVGLRPRRLGALEVLGDLLFAGVNRRLDLRQHPPADAEEDDAEHQQQPEQLREEDEGKLRDLRHWALGLVRYAINGRRG